jgi:hypothetical protein
MPGERCHGPLALFSQVRDYLRRVHVAQGGISGDGQDFLVKEVFLVPSVDLSAGQKCTESQSGLPESGGLAELSSSSPPKRVVAISVRSSTF